MLVFLIRSVLVTLYFKFGQCAYCDQQTIPFPGVLKGATRFYLGGESFVVSCDKGYQAAILNGKFSCNNGVWRGHFPPCIPVSCLAPPPIAPHVKVKSYTGQHMSSVVYECDDFYFSAADFGVKCMFGEWKGSPPFCKDSRCYFRDLKKNVGVLPEGDRFTFSGQNLNVRCDQGYTPSRMRPLCSKGEWTEYGAPCKEVNCTVPEIRNGALVEPKERRVWKWGTFHRERTEVFKKVNVGGQEPPGSVFYISCEAKHTFQGRGMNNVTTYCNKGKWTPNPVCLMAERT